MRDNSQPNIKSRYKANKTFKFDKVPSEFKSVTEDSISGIKAHCTRVIANKFKGSYDARTLYAMVGTVVGNFDLLISKLKEDYSSHLGKLKRAQSLGIKEVSEQLFEFEKTVAAYEMALNRYSDNIADFDGRPLDESLHYSKARLNDFKQRLAKIEEKNHEA